MSEINTVVEKINKLLELMKKEKIDYYIIFTSDFHQSEYVDRYFKTREYMSGFTGSAGTLLISEKESVLWADGRYYVQAANQLKGSGIELYKDGLEGIPNLEEYLNMHVSIGQCVACDGRTISADYYETLSDASNKGTFRTDIDLVDMIWEDRPAMSHNNIFELPIDVCGRDRKEKINNIRAALKRDGLDAFFLADLSSVMWLMNIRGSDVECNPVAFSYAYIDLNNAFLFVSEGSLESELIKKLNNDGVEVKKYNEIIDFLIKINGLKICLDKEEVNSLNYEIINSNNIIKDICNYKLVPKHIKNETEIRLARKYHELDATAMIRFIKYIKEAVKTESLTEMDASDYIDNLRSEINGFMGLSFETISGYGSNGAIVHYSPERETAAGIKNQGLLLVDSGAQYMGATTDITRTIVLGEISEEIKKHFTAVLKAVIALDRAIFLKGTSGANLDILARGPIWNLGIDYRHGTGHGIGSFLNVHEGPQSFKYKSISDTIHEAIVPGMITSDEPGIYIEGSHGIRTENELLCVPYLENEWGTFYTFETLTLVPIDLDAIDVKMLNQDETDWINQYHRRVYDRISPYLNEDEVLWLKEATREI